MRIHAGIGLLLGATAIAQDVTPPDGFRALFNGRDLTGWWGAGTEDPRGFQALSTEERAQKVGRSLADIHEHWTVEDGVLVNDGHGLFLTTLREFGDFELRLEYRTVALADSGIYLRGIPQVQIWDYTEAGGKWELGANRGSGGLWNNQAGAPGKDPAVLADRPFGEWNAFRILMIGEYVTVDFNGQRVVDRARLENYFDRARPVPARGPIQLQTHGGEIRWGNVWVRDVDADEADEFLRRLSDEREGAGKFLELVEGADLAGWRGAVESCDVSDGTLLWRAGEGGTLFTEREFGDFVVEFEFQLPPGGNNGLAIRYPGEGTPAYSGMCELQILDDDHESYAKLDPRQYHGSAYGMVAAERGYLRPAGSWNHELVRVEGSRVRVELNGTRILDADLASVKEFLDDKPHPGLERSRGAFGFCGHGDSVRFRRVRIRELGE
ncbi:MAG: DUF1080 domain-containing protein [Planctomycetes bacterium]|nr:DUF1080 domain-containing protein [Planctomycetota bacterium]